MPATAEVVEGQRGHRAGGRGARGQLHDGRAQPQPLRGRTPPGQRRVGVRSPRFGGEDRVEIRRSSAAPRVRRGCRAAERPNIPAGVRASCVTTFRAGLDPILNPFLEPVLLDTVTTSQSSPVQIDTHQKPLSAPLRLSFDYTRSVGPTLGQFFTALRERRIVGVRGSDGRVYVPPAEFDPVTYERLTEMVPVASVGTVLSWTWQPEPLEGQPLDRPFAWALIKLDGADVPLLHAIDVGVVRRRSAAARGCTCTGPTSRPVRSPTSPTSRWATRPSRCSDADRRPRAGDGPGDAEQHRNPAHRFTSRDRVPAWPGRGQAARRPHRRQRQGVFPAEGSRPGDRPWNSTTSSSCRTRAR